MNDAYINLNACDYMSNISLFTKLSFYTLPFLFTFETILGDCLRPQSIAERLDSDNHAEKLIVLKKPNMISRVNKAILVMLK